MGPDDERTVEALQASGFPFQTAIEDLVRRTPGWSVEATEWPWRDSERSDQFLDIVALHSSVRLIIECKKSRKETLAFLQPIPKVLPEVAYARLLYSHQVQDMTRRLEVYCGRWEIPPASPEARFCVVSTAAQGNDQRMLERNAQSLVRGADAFASHFAKNFKASRSVEPSYTFIPVLVTNAPIRLAQYRPSDVSLKTGSLPRDLEMLSEIPWVRFRKAFTAVGGWDLGDRTVFVVSASAMADFLSRISDASLSKPVEHERSTRLPVEIRFKAHWDQG